MKFVQVLIEVWSSPDSRGPEMTKCLTEKLDPAGC